MTATGKSLVQRHPNGFAGLSSGMVAAFLVSESESRFGVNLTIEEASFIVAAVVSGVLFFGRKVGT